MASIFLSALFALTGPETVPAAEAPAPQDLRCYRLMAELSARDDPRIRSAGLTGAQYFLGRIDARAPGFDPAEDSGAVVPEAERGALIGQCGALMGTGGRDFRAIGERLAQEPGTI